MIRRNFMKLLVVSPLVIYAGNVFSTPKENSKVYTLKSISELEDIHNVIGSALLEEAVFFTEFLSNDSMGYLVKLPVVEDMTRIQPIISDVFADTYRDSNPDILAIKFASEVRGMVRQLIENHKDSLSKNSTIVCNGLSTGGFSVKKIASNGYRIKWQARVV